MASKKFKGKTCAYCGIAGASESRDHVFAEAFFLERHRASLPVVPACKFCNNKKSALETYLIQVLPLGANHADAREACSTLMPGRAARTSNKVLREVLEESGSKVALIDQYGRLQERIPVYVDAVKLLDWCGLVAQGLAFFHWGVFTTDYEVEAVPLATGVVCDIVEFASRLEGGETVEQTVGNGAFCYRGYKCADGEAASMWIGSVPPLS